MPTYSVDTAAVADTAARTRTRIATIQTEVDGMRGDIGLLQSCWTGTASDPRAPPCVGLSASDVALKLRSQGIFQMKQVKRAVQEQNGQLIVVQMGDENPKYPVVTDGVIQVEILESIGRSEEWLLDNLSKQGHDNVANIFIAEYDKGAVTVVTYE